MHKILYSAPRVGKGGKIFTIRKFQTLEENTGKQEVLIPSRRLLRKYGLDEIPQIINILLGDIGVFGVRPYSSESLKEQSILFQKLYKENKPGFLGGHGIAEYKGEEHYSKHDELYLRFTKRLGTKSLSKNVYFKLFLIYYSFIQVMNGHENVDK